MNSPDFFLCRVMDNSHYYSDCRFGKSTNQKAGGTERGAGTSFADCMSREIKWWIVYFMIYLLVYFPLLQRNGMHWDELFDAAGAANGTYIAAGRWGLALYRVVFGLGYMPWVSGIVAGVYIAAALVLHGRLLGIYSRYGKFLYGALYVGCIQWAMQLQYSHQSDAVAFALLCSTLSVYLLSMNRGLCRLFAVGLLVYACSVYQTSILYFLVLKVLTVVVSPVPVSEEWRRYVREFCCVFIAGVLYLISSVVSKSLPIVTEEDLCYMHAIQTGMSKWGEILVAPSLSGKIELCMFYAVCYTKVIIKNLLGMTYEGQWVFCTAICPVIFLLRQYLLRKRDVIRAVLVLSIWVMPFMMTLVVMTDQGARVSLAEPLAVAGLWVLCLKNRNLSPTWRIVCVLFGGFVILKSEYRCAVIAEDEKNIYLSKMDNLRKLDARILSVADSAQLSSPTIIYFGEVSSHVRNPYVKRWGKRRDHQVLMTLPNGAFPDELSVNMRKRTPEEACAYKGIVEKMPKWPEPGSVTCRGNTILVRFGE